MNKEIGSNFKPFLETAGGKITCRRCQARSARSKLQCGRPAIVTSKQSKCQFHGGKSTGPRTQEGRDRIRTRQWKHGERSKKAVEGRSKGNVVIRYLVDIGNYAGLFKHEVKVVGRPGKFYEKLNLEESAQLIIAISRSKK